LKVNPALVEPPPEALERIKREGEKTSTIYRTPGPPLPALGAFLRPVQEPANSRFGSRSIFNGTRSSPHTGADFLSGTGTPIKAPNEGRVRLAEDLYFSGNTVILDHGNGLYSLFAHLSEFKVREGDTVQPGDVVGLVGATGRVTGPHLHWALRVNGARVDPLSLLAVLGKDAAVTDSTPLAVH
jgi:murein DD-endopeptidase MepM/ murein hydrolase activator NlpD